MDENTMCEIGINTVGYNMHFGLAYLRSPRFMHKYENTDENDSDGHQISYDPKTLISVLSSSGLDCSDLPTG